MRSHLKTNLNLRTFDSKKNLVEDDSNVPLGVLIQELTEKKVHKGFAINDMGTLVADSEAERLESTVDDGNDNELGRGKRQKRLNQFYNNLFWRHNNNGNHTDDEKY